VIKLDLGILSLILVYAVLPNLYFRFFSSNVTKKISMKDNSIALTFDDGPDPKYTPLLLDLLRKNDVKCTFFVLAEKAVQYPDLIKRISDEGHNIGLHSFRHMNELLRFPKQTKRDLYNAVKIMNDLGIKIKFFRPPWGIFNPATYHYAKLNHFIIILWSIHAMDWSRYVTVDSIKRRLLKKVQPGDIILLHDGRGAKDAPKKTIHALETVLPDLKKKGYKFVMATELNKPS
jgi:peptidoglycan/xylan/chitin deacetylase (PgdA/CDA1 family)